MKRFLRIFFLVVFSLFVLIQLYPRPKKNNDTTKTKNDFSFTNSPPADIQQILKNSCNDCHSNYTVYPWYASLQPASWWLGDHIEEGKKELNFSNFGTYSIRKKYKKLNEMHSEVKEDKMPLRSYARLHAKAILTPDQKKVFLDWVREESKKMEAVFPRDSLRKK